MLITSTIEEIDVEAPATKKIESAPESKKRKADALQSPAAAADETEGLSKAQKKKLAKKAKRDSDVAPAAPAVEKKAEKKTEKKVRK